jgi:acyl carrier protein
VQAGVWGLGRVAGQEFPERWGGLIDLPAALDERIGRWLCAVLAGCGEREVAVRPAGVFARRLARAPRLIDRPPWQPRGTVLVTGGTGAIGGHVARWAAGQGAPRVVLASRSGPGADGVAVRAAALTAAGGTAVNVIACDAADREQVAGLLARIGADGPPLTAVMHTAGVLDDGLLDGLDTSRLAGVLAAKAAGAAHLDELTRDLALDQFVLFSSAAATLGGAGQGNYAAANAYLDGLAQHRAGLGLAGLSLAWGPWAGGGVAQSSDAIRQRMRRGALPEMDPALAVQALGHALGAGDSLLALMDVNWAQFAAAPAPFLRDLPDVIELAREAAAGPADAISDDLTRQLTALPRTRQLQVLTSLVQTAAATVLGHSSSDSIEGDRSFSDLGFDSLTSLEMRQQLNALTGLRLPATLLFDCPTPAILAEYLRAKAVDGGEAGSPVLEELGKLEDLLSSMARDDERRAEIAVRLASIAQTFHAEPVSDYEFETATNDEMFDLVEQELRDSELD